MGMPESVWKLLPAAAARGRASRPARRPSRTRARPGSPGARPGRRRGASAVEGAPGVAFLGFSGTTGFDSTAGFPAMDDLQIDASLAGDRGYRTETKKERGPRSGFDRVRIRGLGRKGPTPSGGLEVELGRGHQLQAADPVAVVATALEDQVEADAEAAQVEERGAATDPEGRRRAPRSGRCTCRRPRGTGRPCWTGARTWRRSRRSAPRWSRSSTRSGR